VVNKEKIGAVGRKGWGGKEEMEKQGREKKLK
jgi:hypothetical protein